MIDWKNIILQLIGGLSIFLFGMHLLSEGLLRVSGERMKSILAYLTKNRFMGVALGTLVTAVIQSSSATTVMTVGFVNAGIMNLTQAISVIMGANIGTTMTAQIIAFNIMEYAPIMIALGVGMMLFIKNKRWHLYGEALLGLGLLFFGITLMSMGVAPLRYHEATRQIFQKFSTSPLTGVLAGLIMTCILQSSSATIGLAQVLGLQGLIDFNGAVALVLGDNIGTTITAQIAALNANRNARRAAMCHTMFNVIGVCIFLPFVLTGFYQKFIIMITPCDPSNLKHIPRLIANSHTMFNAICTCLFIGPIKLLERISKWLVPVKPDEEKQRVSLLEPHLLDNPPIALDLVRKEIILMLDISKQTLQKGLTAILNKDSGAAAEVRKLEDTTDDYQHAITEYLIALSERELSEEESDQLPTLLHSVNDLERVGDNAENLGDIADELQVRNIGFSPAAIQSLREMGELILRMFEPLGKSVGESDSAAALEVLAIEKKVNTMRRRLDNEHIERLMAGICPLPSSSFYIDAVHYLEKVGDHMKNIAQTAYNLFEYSKGKARIADITGAPPAAEEVSPTSS